MKVLESKEKLCAIEARPFLGEAMFLLKMVEQLSSVHESNNVISFSERLSS